MIIRLDHIRMHGSSKSMIFYALLIFLLVFQPTTATAQSAARNQQQHSPLPVPSSLKAEHAEIQAELAAAMRSGGSTERAAKDVAKLLNAHFVKEEEFAFPILALLPRLTSGEKIPERDELIRRSERFKVELPQMLQEHKAIVAGLTRLLEAARKENKPEQVHFVEKLKLHAQTEEELLYPAALMVGEYLRLRR
ncbi:MAG TPA: hypothetical protein VFM05_03425 [Candidatus Saccharimonadales bacterium]|nr:hypothetical protein [Candidatus Saccharimonadales bacterium]